MLCKMNRSLTHGFSLWYGLFCFLSIFYASNGTETAPSSRKWLNRLNRVWNKWKNSRKRKQTHRIHTRRSMRLIYNSPRIDQQTVVIYKRFIYTPYSYGGFCVRIYWKTLEWTLSHIMYSPSDISTFNRTPIYTY